MTYTQGSRVKVRLYTGQEVLARIVAIENLPAGKKIRIIFGGVIATVGPDRIVEVAK
jgi:hypothetical protein